jgi:TPP-dependent pyruvate/acetoin dehydrogenase alpha subunit
MWTIRLFEERVRQEYQRQKISGMLHLYIGEEAIAVGVCSQLRPEDYITSNHRGHGHFIAKGADLKRMMAELFGKSTGYCKGKGGSMHIADIDLGSLGANGIVGGGLPIAVGAGLAIRVKGEKGRVVVCFFGDGALNTGEFHESLNLAAVWDLPVVFVCENNLYALSTRLSRVMKIDDVSRRADAYGMPGSRVDGMDVLAVREATAAAVARGRAGEGPSFLVCETYRFGGHGRNPDTRSYRTKEEEAEWKARCPVEGFEQKLLREGVLEAARVAAIRQEILEEVEASVRFAEESPLPGLESIEEDIYA